VEVRYDNKTGLDILGLVPAEALQTREGPAFVEYEVEGSEEWSKNAELMGRKLMELVAHTPLVVEVCVRAGRTWIVKKVVTGQDFIGE